jgi:hypothetical protein
MAEERAKSSALGPIAGAIVGALIALVASFYTNYRTNQTTSAGQYNALFVAAVHELGSDRLAVRLGGVYALEEIGNHSPPYHWQTIEILAALVREHRATATSAASAVGQGLPTDIQAALTVIGRRDQSLEVASQRVDLRNANLRGALLENTHLERSDLSGSDLQWSHLEGAHLERADLASTNLQWAYLNQAHLDGANLVGANLTGTELSGTDLRDALVYNRDALKRARDTTPEQVAQVRVTALTLPLQVPGANSASANQ